MAGVCMQGMHGRGHVWQGACMEGVYMAEAGGGMRGMRYDHCSGRYASYWNAFLFSHLLTIYAYDMDSQSMVDLHGLDW